MLVGQVIIFEKLKVNGFRVRARAEFKNIVLLWYCVSKIYDIINNY
tara:strand:- start:1295 stop:1432 length:138 start_codon:yes stop_codon:yes gene_type:complete